MATSTNERVVEVRAARVAGMTGELEDYNFLASMLPQDTRVCDARYCCIYHHCVAVLLYQYGFVSVEIVPASAMSDQG